MPCATPETYRRMIGRALEGGFAYPAVNIHDCAGANAVIEAFAASRSDGIVSVFPEAAACLSGALGDPVLGAITLAEHARRVADRHDVTVALHTDHCAPDLVDRFLSPLVTETERRRAQGLAPLFTSHMFDASALPLADNLAHSITLLRRCAASGLSLEIEIGIVGGAEGTQGAASEAPGTPVSRCYTETADMVAAYRALAAVQGAHFTFAPAFGNVHGVYKPGVVALRPSLIGRYRDAVHEQFGRTVTCPMVFHGGSGSSDSEIAEAVAGGVVKFNVDTDTQFAFTRGVADHMMRHYDKVLRIDGEVGDRRYYFQEAWLAAGAGSMKTTVERFCRVLGSFGRSMSA